MNRNKGVTMKSIPWGLASLCFACAALLAGCGGGNGGDSVSGGGGSGGGGAPATFDDPNMMNGTDVPLSATTSSAGAMEFVKRVAATSDNSAEPIRVGNAVLATSDTDEPDPGV
jgi:hypothetical protein